jgi:hypothetical protein
MEPIPVDDPVVAELLAGANLARLSYIGLDGRPRVVPIWFAFIDGEFIMVTGPKADKVRAIEANGAVALSIDSSTPPYHVLLVDGTDGRSDGMAGVSGHRRPLPGAAADAYLAPMRTRVKTQRRIRVKIRGWRVLDFVKRFPKSLR